MEFRHEKLEVWQLAMDYVDLTYRLTKDFPADEKFGLINQLRRAAVSIALNIAEGASRQTRKEFSQFVRTAIGSLMESDTAYKIALRQDYLAQSDYESLSNLAEKLYFKLLGLNKALRKLLTPI